MQIGGDIYSISKELRNIIHEEMELQAHYIQVLLTNELNCYKEKGKEAVDQYIQILVRHGSHLKVKVGSEMHRV